VNLVRGALAGIVAGLVGAGIWTGVVYFAQYELGIVAWGIGALVGGAVWLGAERRGDHATGAIAAAIAVVAIVLGKWAWVTLIVNDIYEDEVMVATLASIIVEERRETNGSFEHGLTADGAYPPDVWDEASRRWRAYPQADQNRFREAPTLLNSDLYLVYLADEVSEERVAEGEIIDWPTEHDITTAWREAHYPAVIWQEAIERWEAYSPAEQEEYLAWLDASQMARFEAMRSDLASAEFLDSFGGYDVLWFLLAVVTAFRIAALRENRAAMTA
jgi:hypothetical protein